MAALGQITTAYVLASVEPWASMSIHLIKGNTKLENLNGIGNVKTINGSLTIWVV